MSEARIGLIGGLSWESTASYYRYFNEMAARTSEWSQPRVIIDSLDFGEIVELQRAGDWDATGEILADSARRLERGGASVLGIGANTMHINYDVVADAVSIPVVDVRDAVARECLDARLDTIALLGTKYLVEGVFYSGRLEALGLSCVTPTPPQTERLQTIIFDELTRGTVTPSARAYLREVAQSCRGRGANVVGLCCTEFGLLMGEDEPFAVVDSTRAHVRALLAHVT